MPLTSRRIISYINSIDTGFTVHQIAKALSPKEKKIKKRKKKSGSREREDISAINGILRALVSIGYLVKKRKTYIKRDFRLYGRILINSSGNGILSTDEGDEIVIPRGFINAHNNDLVEAEIMDYKQGIYFGNIIRIIERRKERYFAKLVWKTDKYIYFKLLDVYGEEVCAEFPDEQSTGDYAIVRLIDKYISGKQGCIVERFFAGEDQYDVQRIIVKHDLPGEHKEYKGQAETWNSIAGREIGGRKDYKDLFTITIDGERAKDFDDAISLETSGSDYILYVHIADVSAFVGKDSELDREAFKRGTSYYIGNSVIPMLPEALSNDLCSLRQGEERLTLSVEIRFDKKGKEIKHGFYRGIIKVDNRLTYKSADRIIDEKKNKGLHDVLNRMYKLALILKQNRLSSGRMDLNLPDYELVYDNENLKDIEFAERLKSHVIIEEFMLSANEVVSRALTAENIPALYRIHENISEEKMLSLRDFLRSLGIKLKEMKNIGIALQGVIDNVKGREYEQVVNFVILKSFMQAYYGAEPLGHFGLGFLDYTHFTSPIRRYPDLIVHRCLKTLMDKTEPQYTKAALEEIGERSSDMERVAQNAERDLFRLVSCRYMQDKIGQVFDAVVSGVAKSGFFIMLIDKPVEGMVPLRFLSDDYYLVMEDEYSVIGRRLGRRFRIGDRLAVRLRDVFYDSMRIDFDVYSN